MVAIIKIIPALIALCTAALAEISHKISDGECEYKTSLVKIYIRSILVVMVFGYFQYHFNDTSRFYTVTVPIIVMEFLNGFDVKNITRWPIVALSILLTWISW